VASSGPAERQRSSCPTLKRNPSGGCSEQLKIWKPDQSGLTGAAQFEPDPFQPRGQILFTRKNSQHRVKGLPGSRGPPVRRPNPTWVADRMSPFFPLTIPYPGRPGPVPTAWDSWNWISSLPTGSFFRQPRAPVVAGALLFHYPIIFGRADGPLQVKYHCDALVFFIYNSSWDPAHPPREIMVQWFDWKHMGENPPHIWGEDLISLGCRRHKPASRPWAFGRPLGQMGPVSKCRSAFGSGPWAGATGKSGMILYCTNGRPLEDLAGVRTTSIHLSPPVCRSLPVIRWRERWNRHQERTRIPEFAHQTGISLWPEKRKKKRRNVCEALTRQPHAVSGLTLDPTAWTINYSLARSPSAPAGGPQYVHEPPDAGLILAWMPLTQLVTLAFCGRSRPTPSAGSAISPDGRQLFRDSYLARRKAGQVGPLYNHPCTSRLASHRGSPESLSSRRSQADYEPKLFINTLTCHLLIIRVDAISGI